MVVVPGLWSCLVVVGPRVCVGVVCELDSVFVCLQFVLFLCLFLFLSFLVGVARFLWFWGVGGSLPCFVFCSESLILAQDQRWRRA